MTTIQIEANYRVTLPESLRGLLQVGDQVAVTQDTEGRIMIMSAGQIMERLQETFGLWANRPDFPTDGIAYMDQIRQGDRLDEVD